MENQFQCLDSSFKVGCSKQVWDLQWEGHHWEGQGMKKHEMQKVAKGKARGWRVKEGSRKPGVV